MFANPARPRSRSCRSARRPALRPRPARGHVSVDGERLRIARGEPALVLLHTTAGLGTGVSGLATARVNRAPLVVVVGQQDRRHLAYEPFWPAGWTAAGTYPVSVETPPPRTTCRPRSSAPYHSAVTRRGPALVIVPMGDWREPADEEREPAAAGGPVLRAAGTDPETVAALASFLSAAELAGARRRRRRGRHSDVGGARRARRKAPRARLPGGVRRTGRLSAGPPCLPRSALLRPRPASGAARPPRRGAVVGAPAFRRPVSSRGDSPSPARGSPSWATTRTRCTAAAELSVLAPIAPRSRSWPPPSAARHPAARAEEGPADPGPARRRRAADRKPCPRRTGRAPATERGRDRGGARRPAGHPRSPPGPRALGYLSAAQGGLGFALPASGRSEDGSSRRPVVAVAVDGSALYGGPCRLSAVRYGVGPLWVVLSNGGYVGHGPARREGGRRRRPWPCVRRRRGRRDRPRVRLPGAADHDARPSCSPRSTRRCPAWPEHDAAAAGRRRRAHTHVSRLTGRASGIRNSVLHTRRRWSLIAV